MSLPLVEFRQVGKRQRRISWSMINNLVITLPYTFPFALAPRVSKTNNTGTWTWRAYLSSTRTASGLSSYTEIHQNLSKGLYALHDPALAAFCRNNPQHFLTIAPLPTHLPWNTLPPRVELLPFPTWVTLCDSFRPSPEFPLPTTLISKRGATTWRTQE